MRVIWGLLAWSLVEIGLLVVIGGAVGVWATWCVVLGTAVLGAAVLRGQSLPRQVRVNRLQDLAGPLAHGSLRAMAGILLILPGFLTDLVGGLLLIPQVRNLLIGWLGARLARNFPQAAEDDTIEGEAVEVQPVRITPPSGWTRD